MFSGSVNRSINAVEVFKKKKEEYDRPEKGKLNSYPEGDARRNIHEYTSTAVGVVGDILKQTPEPIKRFGSEVVRAGSEIAEGVSEMNIEARKTAPIGVTPLDLLLGVAWGIDKTTKGVSQVTGIDRPILDVGEMFIPYGKILSTLKNAGKVKTVAKVVDTATDLKGAQFAYKAESLRPGFNKSMEDFFSQDLGEVMFLKNSPADLKFKKISRGQVKTDKQLFFTDIYDPEFAAARKLDPKTPIPDMFRYTHSTKEYQHPTGIMTAQKRNQVLPKQLQKLFGRKYATFPGFNMSPHHFTLDDDLAYSVVSKVNKANQAKVVKELNDVYQIYPGNHPKNFMMSYHDNTALRYKQEIKQVQNAWDDYLAKNPNSNLKKPELSEITALQKMPSEGKMIGGKESFDQPLGKTLIEEIDMMADVQKKGLDKKDWSSILPPGVKRSDLKFDPVVLGIDHQALIHGIGDRLPDRLKLLELSKTKKWADMTPAAQAREIAKVSRQQQNVALRISGMRLKLIKKRMTELGKPIDDWTDIQAWMVQNPTEAASLNYHKILSEGVDIPMDVITKDLPLKEAQEIANVFNIEVVNKVGPALDANRAQVKAIQSDIKGK